MYMRDVQRQAAVIPVHDCMEKVRQGTCREAGLGHAGARATQDANAEARIQPIIMRGGEHLHE
jgi:hypothetical protein